MTTIHFWEKPGCQTNARQIEALLSAGHELIVHDLLSEKWTPQRLLDFFIDLPIDRWFNPNAPKVKSGEVVPSMFDVGSALQAMIAEPLLIRRPLIEIGSTRMAGFNSVYMDGLIDANAQPDEACSAQQHACSTS